LRSFPAPVAVYQGDGNSDQMPMITCSDEFCNLVGAVREEIRGCYKDALSTILQEDRAGFSEYFMQNPDQGAYSLRLVRPDGSPVWVRFSYSPFFSKGTRYYYVLYSDISILKEQEEALLEAREQEDKLRQALTEKLSTDNELLRKGGNGRK